VDWRFRITPEISLNNLKVRELGIIGPDVRSGTNRFDTHVGLQEAFVEVKLHDLGPNYDFVSARAEFSSSTRIFAASFSWMSSLPSASLETSIRAASNTTSRFPIPREKHEQRPQHVRTPPPAGAPRQRLFTGFLFPRLHSGIRRRLE